ncbi:hypothetical protein [Pseudotenacibaculum haliotis]|uniref:Uncharacterized protein n=1 Tax=Pseudotenacibaculum haliotis TaxID=1862138 RepID=A0ABW5LUX8_9FLAO
MKALKLITLITLFIFTSQIEAQTKKQEVYRTSKGEKYHKKDCTIIKKKDTLKIAIKEAKKKGLVACKVCHPDNGKKKVKKKKSVSKKKTPSRRSMATRCTGITQRGTRCKRNTKSADGTCWQH